MSAAPALASAHVIWGKPEISNSDSWEYSLPAEGVQVRDESQSSSSLTQSGQARRSSRGSAADRSGRSLSFSNSTTRVRGRPPQTTGDQGLEVNSDCEAVPNHQSQNHELHISGRCRPCNYFFKSVGCNNGDNCTFCHLEHPDLARARPSKTKRDRCKDILKMQQEAQSQPDGRVNEMVGRQSLQGSYMRNIISSRSRTSGETSSAGTASAGIQ